MTKEISLLSSYPKSWDDLHIDEYLNLIFKHPTDPQWVIDWCKGMYVILNNLRLHDHHARVVVTRSIYLLGKVNEYGSIKQYIRIYLSFNPDFMKRVYNLCNCFLEFNTLTNKNIVTVFYGLAMLRMKNISRDFLRRWYPVVYKRMSSFNARELCYILHGHELLDLWISRKLLRYWYTNTVKKIDFFNADELTKVIIGCTSLDENFSRSFLVHWYPVATRKIRSFTSSELSKVLYTHAVMKMKPPQKFMKAWYTAIGPRILTMDINDLYDIMDAHKMLGITLPLI
jgi:hypothetical protein